MSRSCAGSMALCGIMLGATAALTAAEINFDELPADQHVGNRLGLYPSGQYQPRGVRLRTVAVQGEVNIGAVIALRQEFEGFEVIGGPGQPAISKPNFAIPAGGGPQSCLLMEFDSPVTRVRVTTDRYVPEHPDTVRLIALSQSGRDRFQVLSFDEQPDDAIAAPQNQLTVTAQSPMRWVLFQCLTEREGIDDLQFDPIALMPKAPGPVP